MTVKKKRIWVVYGEEETPLGLFLAATPSGALRKYEDTTGKTRDGLHSSVAEFRDGCFLFTELT